MASLRDEFDAVTDVVAPELGVAAWALKAIVIVLILVALGVAFWWIFLSGGQANAKHDVVQAQTQAKASTAMGEAGAHAANVVATGATKETIIHDLTRDHYVEITKQPGAGDPISDELDAAGRHAICMRASAASQPDCVGLQEATPQGMESGRQ